MDNEEVLRAAVVALLPIGEHGFLVQYGSPQGVDLDFFAAIEDPVDMTWPLGGVDLHVMSVSRCSDLLRLLDPLVTEPLLTGEFVAGNRERFDDAYSAAHRTKCSKAALFHLVRRGFDELVRTRFWLQEFLSLEHRRFAYGCLTSLSYSCSYVHFARTYSSRVQAPLLFSDLSQRVGFLRVLRERLSFVKGGGMIKSKELEELLGHWELEIADVRELIPEYE